MYLYVYQINRKKYDGTYVIILNMTGLQCCATVSFLFGGHSVANSPTLTKVHFWGLKA